MRDIDNYGQLLYAVGAYDRSVAYCERILKQVKRDIAIEGWEWVKTPCPIYPTLYSPLTDDMTS